MRTDELLSEIQVILPAETKVTKDATEQFLMSLGRLERPAAFEVVATENAIRTQFVCGESAAVRLRDHLKAFFPDAGLAEPAAPLGEVWRVAEDWFSGVIEFGLSSEFVRPLRRFGKFDPDPLAPLIGAMSSLEPGEVAVYQVLFMPTVNPWAESMLRAVTDGTGKAFFLDDPLMLPLTGEKISTPLFGAVVRMAAQAQSSHRVVRVVQAMAGSLTQFSDPRSNELIPLINDRYDASDHESDLLSRQSRRTGMLLNSEELVSLAHLPSASVREPKLLRSVCRSRAAPAITQNHALALGVNDHASNSNRVTQSIAARLKHTHLIGASGTGKSTLLLNMILHDIERGEGLAVLDPHGDLIDQVLGRVPEERIDDVILLDPSDEEYAVGFNILSARSELERNLLASDLVSVFQRLSTSWGDQMTVVLSNAILAFLENREGGTLADLRRFLVEADYRKQFLQGVVDPEVLYYWQKEFPLLRGNPHAPILTRLNTFLRPKPIRAMVTERWRGLDLFSLMNERKILLAKLAQGLIGEENSYLLGTLLVSKVNQAAMSRQQIGVAERTPFFLYIDEFHNFVTPSMAAILSGARKYGLGLILAHQDLQQISARDGAVASAVISNSYTRVCFRVGDFDAKKLADGFAHFDAQDLQNLGVGEAICRMERAEYDFNLRTLPMLSPDPEAERERREIVIASSHSRWAVRRRSEPPAAGVDEREPKASGPSLPRPVPDQTAQPVTQVSEPVKAQPVPAPPPRSSGRGGQQHKYLQELVKRWAEGNGYRATIEKPILDGLGSVDIALEREEFAVACEVSVTTSAEHELQNVEKCLAAGFDSVVVLATRAKALKEIARAIEKLEASERERVRCFQPEELFAFLEEQQVRTPVKSQTVRGYNVRVKRIAVPADQEEAKKRVIAGAILQSMRRLKGQDNRD